MTFDLTYSTLVFWHVKSIHAVVRLQDDRERESLLHTVRTESPLDALVWPPIFVKDGLTWEQSVERHHRIYAYIVRVKSFNNLYRTQMAHNPLRHLGEDARILDLINDSEVIEAMNMVKSEGVPMPFSSHDLGMDVRGFYHKHLTTGFQIGGIVEWNKIYADWFHPEDDILSPSG